MCPGTERPRPWRTPISSSTSSSATQVRASGAAQQLSAALRPGPRSKRRLAASRAQTPPGTSLPAAPLHFRSAGAGDVGTGAAAAWSGQARSAAPALPALQPTAAVAVCDAGSGDCVTAVPPGTEPPGPVSNHCTPSLGLGSLRGPREIGRQKRAEGDVTLVLIFLISPTFSDLHALAQA